MYSKKELQSGLQAGIFGRDIFVYDSIDSTNSRAKSLANAGAEEGTVVVADSQTAGRGRMGRIWQAEAGSSLLISVIIRPKLGPDKAGLLPFFAAVGVALTIEAVTGTSCECKWPNDILLNGRKCCGILMESTFKNNSIDAVIIGIGINVNQKTFGTELEDKATSLSLECGKDFDRKDIFQRLMTLSGSLYLEVKTGNFVNILQEWKSRAAIFGKNISLIQADEVVCGTVSDIASDGGLIVETKTGRRAFYAGDVTILKQN
jgi:BirA family transcriptional regulator, biotin operon repressor / biotin---[acetyl-CoA-carboxylase] ligase